VLAVLVVLVVDALFAEPLVELLAEPYPGCVYHAAFELTPETLISIPFYRCTRACTSSISARSALNHLRSHAKCAAVSPDIRVTVHTAKPLSRPEALAVTICNTAVFDNAYRAIGDIKARIARVMRYRSNDGCAE
jgi:hypothetical protein